jgi:hypothetical protein
MIRLLSEGKTFASVAPSRRKDGSTFTCEFEITPVFDEKNSVTRLSASSGISQTGST